MKAVEKSNGKVFPDEADQPDTETPEPAFPDSCRTLQEPRRCLPESRRSLPESRRCLPEPRRSLVALSRLLPTSLSEAAAHHVCDPTREARPGGSLPTTMAQHSAAEKNLARRAESGPEPVNRESQVITLDPITPMKTAIAPLLLLPLSFLAAAPPFTPPSVPFPVPLPLTPTLQVTSAPIPVVPTLVPAATLIVPAPAVIAPAVTVAVPSAPARR